jgi:hypothetical protein
MLRMSEVRNGGNHINIAIHSVVKFTCDTSSLQRMFVEIAVISRNTKFARLLYKLCTKKLFLSNK